MKLPNVHPSNRNRLLSAFPADILRSLEATDRQHVSHDVLITSEEHPEWAYFPHQGTVISLTRTTDNGTTVEVGIVGWEGFVSVQTLLTPSATGSNAVIQVPGATSRVRFDKVRDALNKSVRVRELLLASCGAFLAQVSQHAVCNRLHSVEQRLAKWLLGVRDRIDTDQIKLTHDFLAHMLGVRRSGVTVAIGALALDGSIAQGRSNITIRDREGLEARACECYGVMRDAIKSDAA